MLYFFNVDSYGNKIIEIVEILHDFAELKKKEIWADRKVSENFELDRLLLNLSANIFVN